MALGLGIPYGYSQAVESEQETQHLVVIRVERDKWGQSCRRWSGPWTCALGVDPTLTRESREFSVI